MSQSDTLEGAKDLPDKVYWLMKEYTFQNAQIKISYNKESPVKTPGFPIQFHTFVGALHQA